MTRRIITILMMCMAVVSLTAATYSVESVPNVHALDSTQFVTNPDGILSASTVSSLNADIRQEWRRTSVEFVIVAIDNIDRGDASDFATRLFDYWKIGKRDKDNGVLLLVVKDLREVEIRTGYGVEGVLPDIVIGGIVRNNIIPLFKKGDYDGGVMSATKEIISILENPEYAEELRSEYANNRRGDDEDESILSFLWSYWAFMAFVSIILLVWVFAIYSKGTQQPVETYRKLAKWKMPMMMLSAIGLGAPLIAYLPLNKMMKSLRDKPRKCSNCGGQMAKLDEESDNYYLDPKQNTEERLNSVDYDVWLCKKCGETDVIAYPIEGSIYKECPRCGAKAYALHSDRVVAQPTTKSEGLGVRTKYCRHCGFKDDENYRIPKKVDEAALALGAGLALGSSGRGGFGGIGGGSFGGGRTGGGGAGGHW